MNSQARLKLFTESSLVDTIVYRSFNKNSELNKIIVSGMKNSITIDKSYISEQLMQINRTKISPLSEEVLNAYYNGNIVLLYSKKTNIPQALPFFASKIKGKVTVIIFINNYGTIAKAESNDQKYLSISMKDLYVLLEGAYIAYRYAILPAKVTKNLGLMKVSTQVYTSMLLRILNKEYAISMDQSLYGSVSFCVARFFIERVWMSVMGDDLNFSYARSVIDKTKVGVDMNDITVTNDLYTEAQIKSADELIKFLATLSPRLKTLNFRYFLQCYINTFKPAAMFSLECLPYFLFTIEASLCGSFIVNQPILSDITKYTKSMNTFYPELVKAVS